MMTYGYPIKDSNDPFIDIVDKATEQFAQASSPGAFLVDTLPISTKFLVLKFMQKVDSA